MQHTTTQPRINVGAQTHQTVFNKSIFVIALAGLGGLSLLTGIISLVSAIVLFSNASMPSLFSTLLANAVLDITVGTLMIASSKAFAKGRILAVWLLGGSILLDCLYSLIMGYELHYILIGLGFLLIWQMLKFREEWKFRNYKKRGSIELGI